MFVIFVLLGKEDEILCRLTELGYTAYVPKTVIIQRKNGICHNVSEVLFPGYIFIDLKKVSDSDYYQILGINGVSRFLSVNVPLSAGEEEYIGTLCADGSEIGISKGVLIGGKLKITKGFLKRYENKIVKYSRRQHRATIELTLYGKPHRIVCGIDIEKTSGNGVG